MYFTFLVPVPVVPGKIVRKTIKGTIYIYYEYAREYDSDKKYNIPKRAAIGKQSENNPLLMFPNPNYRLYFPEVELPEKKPGFKRSSCLRIGAFLVIP